MVKKLFAVAAIFVFCQFCFASTDEQDALKFFRDLAETRNYVLGQPVKPKLTPDGTAVLFLRGGSRDPKLRLYEMEVATGKVQELLTPESLLKGASENLTVQERARRERMRNSLQGFTAFDLSDDGSKLLVQLSGKIYVFDRINKKTSELPLEDWIDPRFSKDASKVAAVRDGELYIIDLATLKAHQLTNGASETISHGLAEFAAEEEMDRHHGFWWSPDSKWIALQQTDVSAVEKHYIANPLTPEQRPNMFYYPRTGTANAVVRLGVMPAQGGEMKWIQWDAARYPYLARVAWMENSPLTILVMTRDQREEKLLAVDQPTGSTHELLTETDAAWINLDENPEMPHWLKDGNAFLWTTERRGGTQMELRNAKGELVRELAPADCECADYVDVNENQGVVVTAGGPDPRETQLYQLSLNGGAPVQITHDPGKHEAVYSKNHNVYVHTFDLKNGKRGMQVLQNDGKVLSEVPSVAEKPAELPNLEFTPAGKDPALNAVLIRSHQFDPSRKYPVILSVYAGPTSLMVKATPLSYLREQWYADQGFVVVSIDNRGTPGRGRDWERIIKDNLIDVALEDQVNGLKALGEKYPELDLSHVGVTGWSFGGYFSAMATIRRPDVFQCGVAGAPVVDWEDYDTFYTERYMDLPSANPEGYKKSNVLTYADQLQRPLLLIHGLTDDNVYVEHTLKLIDALYKAGKPYEFMPILSTHMVPDPVIKLRMEMRILNFFNEHLKNHEVTKTQN